MSTAGDLLKVALILVAMLVVELGSRFIPADQATGEEAIGDEALGDEAIG